jgi:hypothetical protein
MQINHPRSVESTAQRGKPLKLIPAAAGARMRRAIEDPLMVVLLVWAFVFVVLLLINAFA